MDINYNKNIILNSKTPTFVSGWIWIIFIFITLIILVGNIYEYDNYIFINGKIKQVEDKYYVDLFVKKNELIYIYSGNLIINKKTIEFKLDKISDEFTTYGNNEPYVEILISGNIDNKLLVENNLVQTKWLHGKTTIIKELAKILKKGITGWNN